MKKKWLFPVLFALALFSLSLPLATATVSDTLGSIGNKVISMGNLGWMGYSDGSVIVGLTRILIWLLVFALLFAVMTGLGGAQGSAPMKFFNRTQAGVIAAIIATITAVFLPTSVLLATGAGWATLVAFVLVGLPVVGIAWLLWQIPWEGEETKFTVFLKLILCLVLFWVLSAMKYHLEKVL